MNDDASTWNRLINFVCEDEGITVECARKELEADGIDCAAFLAKTNLIVRRGLQEQLRQASAMARSADEKRRNSIRMQVAAWPVSQLLEILRAAEMGTHGMTGQRIALAFRNHHSAPLSSDELRTIAEDILMAADLDHSIET